MAATLYKDIEVHWGDLDALNHVNTTAYLRYMEDARIAWLAGMDADWDSRLHAPSVVNINCNFRREIRFPAMVRVQLTAILASDKRVLHQYRITNRDDPTVLYADAEATVVWIDRNTRRSIIIPDGIKTLLEESTGTPC